MYRVVFNLSNGISSKLVVERSSIDSGGGSIKDARFVGDQRIMLICCSDGKAKDSDNDAGKSLCIPLGK